jgi:hypothetical protein
MDKFQGIAFGDDSVNWLLLIAANTGSRASGFILFTLLPGSAFWLSFFLEITVHSLLAHPGHILTSLKVSGVIARDEQQVSAIVLIGRRSLWILRSSS